MEAYNSMPAFPPGTSSGDGYTMNNARLELNGFTSFDQQLPFDDSAMTMLDDSNNAVSSNGISVSNNNNNSLSTRLSFNSMYNFDQQQFGQQFTTTYEDPFNNYPKSYADQSRATAVPRLIEPVNAVSSHSQTPGHNPIQSHIYSHGQNRSRSHSHNRSHNGEDEGGASPSSHIDHDNNRINDSHDENDNTNKLLGFSAPLTRFQLWDDATGTCVEPVMKAELYGMFFVAEDVFGNEPAMGRPQQLTCYRRNLWQCSGTITLPRHCTQVVDEQGRMLPISEFYASIVAVESIDQKTTEIISIPWKSQNSLGGLNPSHTTHDSSRVTAGPPPRISLDLNSDNHMSHLSHVSTSSLDQYRVAIPVTWKRLQFKSATANNGRRKGLQQHYIVQVKLLGRIKSSTISPNSDQQLVQIAEVRSGPVIVRGRSPRNFDSRRDVVLSGDKKTPGVSFERRCHGDISASTSTRVPLSPSIKQEHLDHTIPKTPNPIPAQTSDLTDVLQPPPAKRAQTSPSLSSSRPTLPRWSSNQNNKTPISSEQERSNSLNAPPSISLSLSLSEDERSPKNHSRAISEDLSSPMQFGRTEAGHGRATSPSEEDDEALYEYFPLSVDDWTPLVETVYRPHIVHHIAVPQEIQAQNLRSKKKRYFSAD